MPQTRSERIHQGRGQDGDRIRCDGVRWVFREARLYPHQQYHRRIWLGKFMQERQDSEMVEAVKSNSVVFRSAERVRFFFKLDSSFGRYWLFPVWTQPFSFCQIM